MDSLIKRMQIDCARLKFHLKIMVICAHIISFLLFIVLAVFFFSSSYFGSREIFKALPAAAAFAFILIIVFFPSAAVVVRYFFVCVNKMRLFVGNILMGCINVFRGLHSVFFFWGSVMLQTVCTCCITLQLLFRTVCISGTALHFQPNIIVSIIMIFFSLVSLHFFWNFLLHICLQRSPLALSNLLFSSLICVHRSYFAQSLTSICKATKTRTSNSKQNFIMFFLSELSARLRFASEDVSEKIRSA